MSRNTLSLALLCVLLPAFCQAQIFRGRNSNRQNNRQPPTSNQPQAGAQTPIIQEQQPQPQIGATEQPTQPSTNATQFQQVRQPYTPKLHWSQTLTSEREHDFGTVAKAQNKEHIFTFVNSLDTDLFLTNVRTSCGCTKPSILTSVVKPGETAKVLAKFDTMNFEGQRGATVTVSMQKRQPYYESAEIQFSVRGMIRRDVVLTPGAVDFGNVLVGNPAQFKLQIKYAGNPNWQITEVRSSNAHISGNLVETRRDSSARRVDYDLQIQTDGSLPQGTFSDELILVTNDSSNQLVKVGLSGLVKLAIQAAPIQLGTITQGPSIEKTMILKGEKAFEIMEIRHSSPRIQFEKPEGSKPLHMVKYKFDATLGGQVDDTIIVVTNDASQPEISVPFSAMVNGDPNLESTFAKKEKE